MGAGGGGDNRGWDCWMASLTRWPWVWVNSGSWWWTGRLGVLRFMGSQRAGHDWATELNWTECFLCNHNGFCQSIATVPCPTSQARCKWYLLLPWTLGIKSSRAGSKMVSSKQTGNSERVNYTNYTTINSLFTMRGE